MGRINAASCGSRREEGSPVAGSVYASTGSGQVHITLEDARGATQKVEVFTRDGRRYVRATGIAGRGRGLIKIKAVNGNVTLRRAR